MQKSEAESYQAGLGGGALTFKDCSSRKILARRSHKLDEATKFQKEAVLFKKHILEKKRKSVVETFWILLQTNFSYILQPKIYRFYKVENNLVVIRCT